VLAWAKISIHSIELLMGYYQIELLTGVSGRLFFFRACTGQIGTKFYNIKLLNCQIIVILTK
jgi:hypothetical protein